MSVRGFLAGAILVAVGSCGPEAAVPGGSLEGVWRIVETRTVGPEGEVVNDAPLPGFFSFAERHYSMTWSPGRERLPDNVRTWFPTDEEKTAQHDAIIVNAGTYELTDSILTVRPLVAKTPEYVGGLGRYSWRVVADTLWVTTLDIRARTGVQDPFVGRYRSYHKLTRAE